MPGSGTSVLTLGATLRSDCRRQRRGMGTRLQGPHGHAGQARRCRTRRRMHRFDRVAVVFGLEVRCCVQRREQPETKNTCNQGGSAEPHAASGERALEAGPSDAGFDQPLHELLAALTVRQGKALKRLATVSPTW